MANRPKIVRPPALARMVLRLSSGHDLREAMLGDLEEEFARRAQRDVRSARAWYCGQALNSAVPLVQQRVNQSAVTSTFLVVVLTGLAFVCVRVWDVMVARTVAGMVARSFETAPPFAVARFVYVAAQMFIVGAAAVGIAAFTFRVENGILKNTASRLGMLAVLVLAPQFIAYVGTRGGYSLDFLIPWAGAMVLAIAGGAALATRFSGRR